MQGGDVGQLLGCSLPVALAGSLHHGGRHLLQSTGVHLCKLHSDVQLILVLHIDVVHLVPHLTVDVLGLHHIPAIGVAHHLGNLVSMQFATP